MIPKILHIIWIGNEARRPDPLIQTWVQQHPGWELRIWGNDDLVGRDWRCRRQMFELGHHDCAAVADVMRWEILLAEGGVCVAADSVCLRPLDEALLDLDAFACWENELAAPGVVSAAYFGCHPGNPLVARLVETIANTPDIARLAPSEAAGSALLTRCWREVGQQSAQAALTVLPSHSFIPRHPKGPAYNGGGSSYACELWASTLGILDDLPTLNAQAVAARLAQSQAQAALQQARSAAPASASAGAPGGAANVAPVSSTGPVAGAASTASAEEATAARNAAHAQAQARANPAPLFSIVIPTYNRAATLAEALGSALAQEGGDFEVLVVDDGSTDSTQALLQRLLDTAHGPASPEMDDATAASVRACLRVVRQANAGTAQARNRGVVEARGRYIVWLDSDDALLPGCLNLYRRRLAEGPAPDVMYGHLLTIDAQGRDTGRIDYPDYAQRPLLPDLLLHNRLPNPGSAVRRGLFESIGGYDDKLPASEDYDFWLRAAAGGARFRFAGGEVCRWRVHPGSRSASAQRNNAADALIALKALRQTPLPRLFPQLDWGQPVAARAQAFLVATQLFVARGCWREAAEFAAGLQLCAAALAGEEVLPPHEAVLAGAGAAALMAQGGDPAGHEDDAEFDGSHWGGADGAAADCGGRAQMQLG